MKKTLITVGILALVGIIFIIGYNFGTKKGAQRGMTETKKELQPLVDIAFPKPPEEIFSLSGTVRDVVGATISMMVNDPNDYLPHTDGSAVRQEVRFASLTPRTIITKIDPYSFDAQGSSLRTALKLSDIKKGMMISVMSDTNIRAAQRFDVKTIDVVSY